MTVLVPSTEEAPAGSHVLSFYASDSEAAESVAGFLRGARGLGQPAIVLTSDAHRLNLYESAVARRVPQMAGVFRLVSGPHLHLTPEGLRPPEEVEAFTNAHARGASTCSDAIPDVLTRENLDTYLEYERWYDTLRPYVHRGMCPYDVTRLPVDLASWALQELADVHSHVVLSRDPSPAVQLLQLLVVATAENPAAAQRDSVDRALTRGVVQRGGPNERLELTPRGENLVRALLTFPS
jgi:DcmR-like sensory protein